MTSFRKPTSWSKSQLCSQPFLTYNSRLSLSNSLIWNDYHMFFQSYITRSVWFRGDLQDDLATTTKHFKSWKQTSSSSARSLSSDTVWYKTKQVLKTKLVYFWSEESSADNSAPARKSCYDAAQFAAPPTCSLNCQRITSFKCKINGLCRLSLNGV